MPSIDNIFGAPPTAAAAGAASGPSIDNIFGDSGAKATTAAAAPATPSVDNIFAKIPKTLDTSGSKIASNMALPTITPPKPANTSSIGSKFMTMNNFQMPSTKQQTSTPAITSDQTKNNDNTFGGIIKNTAAGLPAASEKVSSVINDVVDNGITPIIKPATDLLSNTDFMKQAAAGVDAGAGTEAVNLLTSLKNLPADTLQGVTGGAYQAPKQNDADILSKGISAFGQGVGMLLGIGSISAAVKATGALGPAIDGVTTLLNKYPLTAKYIAPFAERLISDAAGFATYSQLNPNLAGDLHARGKDLLISIGESPIYTALGTIKSVWASAPASFVVGFSSAKLSGASNAEAVQSGLVFAFMDGVGRGASQRGETLQEAQTRLKSDAAKTLSQYGIKVTPNSTAEELKAAYHKAAHVAHPDVGGINEDFVKVQSAYDLLSKGAISSNKPGKTEAEQSVKALSGDVKKSIEVHGELATHQALMDNVGLDEPTATRLVKAAQTPHTEAEQKAVIEAHIQQQLAARSDEVVTAKSNEYVNTNLPALTDKYIERFGNQVGTDEAKELVPGYEHDRSIGNLVQDAAGKISQATFDKLVDTDKNNTNQVLISAGGTGAGKSTLLRSGTFKKDDYAAIRDSNMNNSDAAIKRIDGVLAKGKKVDIAFVYAPVKEAYNRALSRTEQMVKEQGSGRPVAAQGHIDTHHGSYDTMKRLLEHYKDNKDVTIRVFDNSGSSITEVKDPIAFIDNVIYNKEDEEQLHTDLNSQRIATHREGGISDKTNRAYERAEKAQPQLSRPRNEGDEQKPQKQDAAKSVLNLQAGFVDVGKMAEDVAATISRVQDTIKELENVKELSGDIRDAGYQHENKRVANRQRLINLAKEVGDMLDAQGWNDLYHYDENSEEKITPEQKALYDGVIKPLKDSLSNIIVEYKQLGGQLDSELFFMENEGYTPRFAKDKNSSIDKIINDFKAVGTAAKKTLQNGGLLSKSLGTVDKSRKFFALTDEQGTRSVAHIPTNKSQQVLGFNKGKITELGKYNLTSNSKLLNKELAPVKKKITSLQKTVAILKSIKTRDPVSEQKLINLKNRISDLKSIIKENKSDPLVAIHASLSKDINKISDEIDTFEVKYKTLKPFEQKSPAIAKQVAKFEERLSEAYERESNLSLSDIYEQVGDVAKNSNEISEKSQVALEKTITEFKALSKVKSADKVVLTSKRIATLERKIVEASNMMADIEGTYNPGSLNKKSFVDKDGNRYQVGQATTKEIEANTKVRYHTNVLANYLVALDRATNALNAMRLLERIKNEDEFGDIIRKDNPDEATPDGWKSVGDVLPQFRGYHVEPRAAEVLQDLASRQKGQLHIPVLDEINNFLVGAIVFNPVMHVPNVIAGRSAAAAALGVPTKSLVNLQHAFNEVKTAGPLYLSYLEHGAPFMALKGTTRNFTDAILTQYTSELENEKDPGLLAEHEQLAKILGYTNPAAMARGLKHINETATWGSNDVLFMHALMDYKDVHGGTMEEAIKAVSKYMADYRIPERIFFPGQAGRVMSHALQSRAFLFGRFHYTGVIKPWLESIKDSAGPGSTGKQRLQGLRALTYMLLMGLMVWPYINKMWQGITGSATTHESMPGPLRPIEVAQKVAEQGVSGIPYGINSIFTVSPVYKSMIELGFNINLFTHNPIYGPLPAQGLSSYGLSVISPLASASRMNPGDFALSLFGIWTPKNVPALTTLNQMKYNELPALQTQVKKDITAGNQKKADEEMREFNTRAIATWNEYELETGGKNLVTTNAQKQEFLKQYGIKGPGAVALSHANTLYGDGSLTSKSSLISNIATYAKAIGVSPSEAFHLIFSGQTIAKVDNFSLFSNDAAIIVQRMSLADSEAEKTRQEAAQGATSGTGLQLDHVIPLEGGGTNDVNNLNLITTQQDGGEQQKLEDFLGKSVKAGTISQAKVHEYAIRYKAGMGQTLSDSYMKEYANKYGGKPISFADIQAAVKDGTAK